MKLAQPADTNDLCKTSRKRISQI